MRRIDMLVWSPFLHRRRIRRDRKLQPTRLLPNLNGLHERARRKYAMSFSTRTATHYFCSNRIRNTRAKHPLGGRWNLGKSNHLFPDLFPRCMDSDRRAYDKSWCRRCHRVFRPFDPRNKDEQRRKVHGYVSVKSGSPLHPVGTCSAESSQRHRDRGGHNDADYAFEG